MSCILAYLEPSDVGYRIYSKLGFEKIDTVKTVIDGELVEEYPAMLRRAPTTLWCHRSKAVHI
jgi:hypothetical protein